METGVYSVTISSLKEEEKRDERRATNGLGNDEEIERERRKKSQEEIRWMRGWEMGEMPRAAERRDNCHMQSWRGRACVFVCLLINHFISVLCYYLGEQGNLPPSALRQTVYKPHRRYAAGIRSKHGDNGLKQSRQEATSYCNR